MKESGTLLIGFVSQDEAKLSLDNGRPPWLLRIPGGIDLAEKIFEAAGFDQISLDQIGSIGTGVSAVFAFEDGKLRSIPSKRHTVTREVSVAHDPPLGKKKLWPPEKVVAVLRNYEAAEQFVRSSDDDLGERVSGVEHFRAQVERRIGDEKLNSIPWIFVLGILPGPAQTGPVEHLEKIELEGAGSIRGRRILITYVRAFRDAGFRIREDGSTSAAVEDIYGVVCSRTEVESHNNSIENIEKTQKFLSNFDEVIVRIRADAVLHFYLRGEAEPGQFTADLYYIIEGDRQAWVRYREGNVGFDFILAAMVASGNLNVLEEREDILETGLKRMWLMLKRGFADQRDKANIDTWKKDKGLPFHRFLDRCDPRKDDSGNYWDKEPLHRPDVHRIEVLDGDKLCYRNYWTLFREVCEDQWKDLPQDRGAKPAIWDKLAIEIARKGPLGARNESRKQDGRLGLPYRVFALGKVNSMDRNEIDGLISLQQIFFTYLGQLHPKRPLCVGVFGAPGSGKSFGVKEIAKSLHDWNQPVSNEPLEYNVAQFTSLDDLCSALHAVRDLRLETGEVPVVIFDEFDAEFESRAFGWLQYFLMPMQDGKFREGASLHHTGPAIFIFAGGINHSFGEFSSRQRDRDFCAAKGPDFISRLRGIHNVPPLNKPENFNDEEEYPDWKIRRAILLHSYFARQRVKIEDDGLLAALLNVPRFHHGARSLEAIIEMCVRFPANETGGRSLIGRSSLPSRDQLDLHLDASLFWEMLRENSKSRTTAEAWTQ